MNQNPQSLEKQKARRRRKADQLKAPRHYMYKNHSSAWVQGFNCESLKVLIVCRGPIRMEAMEVYKSIGADFGILISEKDSVTYPMTLAPELRIIKDQSAIHNIPDYTGVTSTERKQRIADIIDIAKQYDYTHIFAGYGFMAEDHEFVSTIEAAGVGFIGPEAKVHQAAGAKDEAKKLSRRLKVSVTPGLDNITACTLVTKAGGTADGLDKIASANSLKYQKDEELELTAENILQAGYAKGVGIITLEEIQAEARKRTEKILTDNPGKRLRYKVIGGGGGKGQRIVTKLEESDNAVVECLMETKAMGEADNKNFLIELNIENTRHNEIQLLGNGEWCVSLGGRDCSLQMHEQKLLELSITDELYAAEIEKAKKDGHDSFAAVMEADRKVLQEMEKQAEAFGEGVNLNSASTFECIVSDQSFYFMEMNTRIQVEHRVTEMAYFLRFRNPANRDEYFDVKSLVEAMALVALHGKNLPRPERVSRNIAGAEIRLNATNDALQPHAGGIIENWSVPSEREIRDDQGIGIRNPDTGWFIKYNLAGAYDSNIALLVTNGEDRLDNLLNLRDILRRTELRGVDIQTNRFFHYGVINACIGLHPMLKPDTGFVVPYLTGVGALAKEMDNLDFDTAWKQVAGDVQSKYGEEAQATLIPKTTFINRPLQALLANPHTLAGWLLLNRNRSYELDGNTVVWKRNPFRVLADLYKFLHLEHRAASPAQMIWNHDQDLLMEGLEFYNDLENGLGIDTEKAYQDSLTKARKNESKVFETLDAALRQGSDSLPGDLFPNKLDEAVFAKCCAAHRGWQTGLSILNLLVIMGKESGILEFEVGPDLKPIVPAQFMDAANQKTYLKALAPPPVATGNEIVAVTGGMYYGQETPIAPPFVQVGDHFEPGDTLYIIEVMKMFNKVQAEFAGTVEEILITDAAGTVVKKGQALIKVKPDEEIHIESDEEKAARMKKRTQELLEIVG